MADSKINRSTGVVVEIQNEPTIVVKSNTANSVEVKHNKAGYACWLLGFSDYRTNLTWNVHYKRLATNEAVLDILNTSDVDYTTSSAYTAWLCIPSNHSTPPSTAWRQAR